MGLVSNGDRFGIMLASCLMVLGDDSGMVSYCLGILLEHLQENKQTHTFRGMGWGEEYTNRNFWSTAN